jgi:hypothetical protein
MKSGPKTPSVEADYTLYGFLKADFPDTLKHTLYTSVCARLADEFQDEDPRRAWQLSPHGALWHRMRWRARAPASGGERMRS